MAQRLGHLGLLGLEIVVEDLDDLKKFNPIDPFAGIREQGGADQGEGSDYGYFVDPLDDFEGQIPADDSPIVFGKVSCLDLALLQIGPEGDGFTEAQSIPGRSAF
jgi:hypothetical protein